MKDPVSPGKDAQSKDEQGRQSADKQPKREPRHARLRKHALVNKGKSGEPKWILRRFCQLLAYTIMLPLFRVKVTGVENIPKGPCLLSPNHISYADGLIVFALTLRYRMPMRVLAKRELWSFAPLGWVLDSAGVMPISREKADLDTLRMASSAIKAGDSMAIFPEGTRVRNEDMKTDKDRGMGEAFGGAAWLAIRNDVPVISVAIAGTELIRPEGMKLMRFPRVVVHFGTPLVPDEVVPSSEYKRKDRIAKLTELVMDGLAQALEIARKENAARGRRK
ncbi:MAG: 1-acyl-sn-glycerol-3-phosphate acyltransferase [Coriobacteriia bacterium]|nr:1-acyl-sn-glycerol-3-phosphate acyltransferase [Coriobacteriia bacterium]